ncbi:MAG: bifunctional diaminohydroxyphosphoribosylaminopyrimidine deaminase/5-amino-6-(5-phosphoribosylamino)uracil reductase RibD [Thiotrichaceae bacterium]
MIDEYKFSSKDSQFMAKAIQLAKKGLYTTHPNPRVGCVITQQDKIIAEGWHERAGQAHAEINALNQLTPAQSYGATAYVTLEPCSHTGRTSPCSQALIKAGIKRVVVAMQDPNPLVAGNGLQQLREAGIETDVGLMESSARELNPGFIKRMEQGLPWVSVKLAMSLDGRTAMASGESKWITSKEARKDVQFLRAKAAAILTGQGTVLADDPSLNVRLSAKDLDIKGEIRQPIRVVLDPELKMSPDSLMLGLEGETLIVTTDNESSHIHALRDALRDKGVTILTIPSTSTTILPLRKVLESLAKREINDIHVEAGATLCGALIQEGLVDELIIYMAPHIMGSDARGLLNLPGLERMQDKIHLDIKDIRAIGSDWRIIARPQNTT